jgi:hypothetical protein
MAKRRYRFGPAYLGKLQLRYSYEYGWWVTDGYAIWFPVFEGQEQND